MREKSHNCKSHY